MQHLIAFCRTVTEPTAPHES